MRLGCLDIVKNTGIITSLLGWSNQLRETRSARAKQVGLFPTKLTRVARRSQEASKAKKDQEAGEVTRDLFPTRYCDISLSRSRLDRGV
jgi:hypothetical protein